MARKCGKIRGKVREFEGKSMKRLLRHLYFFGSEKEREMEKGKEESFSSLLSVVCVELSAGAVGRKVNGAI